MKRIDHRQFGVPASITEKAHSKNQEPNSFEFRYSKMNNRIRETER